MNTKTAADESATENAASAFGEFITPVKQAVIDQLKKTFKETVETMIGDINDLIKSYKDSIGNEVDLNKYC